MGSKWVSGWVYLAWVNKPLHPEQGEGLRVWPLVHYKFVRLVHTLVCTLLPQRYRRSTVSKITGPFILPSLY